MPRTWLLHPYRYIQTMDQNHPGKEYITAQLGFFFSPFPFICSLRVCLWGNLFAGLALEVELSG